jgi:hypothetical protein
MHMKPENPLPRTDLPEFTAEELKEIESRPKDANGRIPVTMEEVLRSPKGSLTGWRLLPEEEAEARRDAEHERMADELRHEMCESIEKLPPVH